MRSDARVPYPLNVSQTISASGTSARTTNGVGTQSRSCVIATTVAGYYTLGDSSVAATAATGTYLPENAEHYIRIRPGQYVAFITVSGTGNVYVSEMDG